MAGRTVSPDWNSGSPCLSNNNKFKKQYPKAVDKYLDIRELSAHSRRAGKQNRDTHPGEGEREKTDVDRPVFYLCAANRRTFEDRRGVPK